MSVKASLDQVPSTLSSRDRLKSNPCDGGVTKLPKSCTDAVPGKKKNGADGRRSRIGSLLSVRDVNARSSKSSISSLDSASKDKDQINSKIYRNSSQTFKENIVPKVLLTKAEDVRLTQITKVQETGTCTDPVEVVTDTDSSKSIVFNVKKEDVVKVPEGVINVCISEGLYEYSQEAFHYLKEIEKSFTIPADYLENGSITSSMRITLVDWLIQVQHHLRLSQESLYLCVNIVDYVLHKRDVDPDKLQLVGITSLLIATKIEEYYPVEIEKLLHLTECSYSRVDVLLMERIVLQILEFKVYMPSPQLFLLRYSQAALKGTDDQFYKTCCYILDTHLIDPHHSCIPPSVSAGSAVFLAQLLYKLSSGSKEPKPSVKDVWTPTLEYFSRLSHPQLLQTSLDMVNQMLLSCGESYKFKGAVQKYQSNSQHKRLAYARHVQKDVLKKALRIIVEWS